MIIFKVICGLYSLFLGIFLKCIIGLVNFCKCDVMFDIREIVVLNFIDGGKKWMFKKCFIVFVV